MKLNVLVQQKSNGIDSGHVKNKKILEDGTACSKIEKKEI